MLNRRDMLSGTAVAAAALSGGFVGRAVRAQGAPAGPGFDIAKANADYQRAGIPMWPFRVKVVNGTRAMLNYPGIKVPFIDRDQITWWRVEGQKSVVPNHVYEFLPLGDSISVADGGQKSTAALLLAPDASAPDALAHPIGFKWTEDDFDGHGDAHFAYMDLVPPPGYVALGQAWQGEGHTLDGNDLKKYWCVKVEHVRNITNLVNVWSDHGTGWHHDGNMHTPAFGPNDLAPRDAMFLLPLTYIGAESSMKPKSIRAQRPVLQDLATDTGAEPTFNPRTRSGATFSPGISRIVAMPCTAFTDAGIDNKAAMSPVYYVVDRPIWKCIQSDTTPQGGTKRYTRTIGVETTDSVEFNHTTSSTISAEGGFDIKGVSAKVSTSFTEEFSLTTGHTTDNRTEFTEEIIVNLPTQPITQFWQLYSEIGIYRMDGSLLKKALYGRGDYRFLPLGNYNVTA